MLRRLLAFFVVPRVVPAGDELARAARESQKPAGPKQLEPRAGQPRPTKLPEPGPGRKVSM